MKKQIQSVAMSQCVGFTVLLAYRSKVAAGDINESPFSV